ncbi:MAG: hypothetical protein IT436_00165 [Phycisphaerales bacterium]|nr:hypothetical protein [Phycisphaerales bacterium]
MVKPPGSRADASLMVEFSTPAWIGIAAVAALGVLAMLNAAAGVIRNQTYVHDTRVRVNTLRIEYFGREEDAQDDQDIVVDVAETPGPGRPADAKAA